MVSKNTKRDPTFQPRALRHLSLGIKKPKSNPNPKPKAKPKPNVCQLWSQPHARLTPRSLHGIFPIKDYEAVGKKAYPILDYKVVGCFQVIKKYTLRVGISRIIYFCSDVREYDKSIIYKSVQIFHVYMTWSRLPEFPIGLLSSAIADTVSGSLVPLLAQLIAAPNINHEAFNTVLTIQQEILKYLAAGPTGPTTNVFLRQYMTVLENRTDDPLLRLRLESFPHHVFAGGDHHRLLTFLVDYIGELSLLKYKMLFFPPSIMAASIIFLARFILLPAERPWMDCLRRSSRHLASELRDCVLKLHKLFLRAQDKDIYRWGLLLEGAEDVINNSVSIVPNMYRRAKVMSVANLPCPVIPVAYFVD